jgi:hypothetical protein
MIPFEEEREFNYNNCVPVDKQDPIHSDPRHSRCSHTNVEQAGVGLIAAVLLLAATVQKASSI